MQISIPAILVAAVSTFIIGGLWYGVLFRQAWMAANSFTEDQVKGGEARIFSIALVLALVMAANLAAFLGKPDTTMTWGATAGALTGVWIVGAIATVALFERRPFGYIAINGGYWMVSFIVMGAIIGAWR